MRPLVRLVFAPLLALAISSPESFAREDGEPGFSQAELDQMLAPVALYPDTLLSQILTAATYPLEVVSAARWSRGHPGLEGQQAVDAVADKDWDPSVKALVAFPRVLEHMYEDLDWTTRLGDAFLYQEAQVLATVQGLRQRAYEAGNLDSTGNVRVIREQDAIAIEPVHPRVVYVPYYDSRVIYGAWWWPAYPPVYWAPPPGLALGAGFYFGSGVHVSTVYYFSTIDWHHDHIVFVHRHRFHHQVPHHKLKAHVKHHGRKWRHDSKHRRGVAYRHSTLSHRHGRSKASGIVYGRDRHTGSRVAHHRPYSERDVQRRDGRKFHSRPFSGSRATAGYERRRAFDRIDSVPHRARRADSGVRAKHGARRDRDQKGYGHIVRALSEKRAAQRARSGQRSLAARLHQGRVAAHSRVDSQVSRRGPAPRGRSLINRDGNHSAAQAQSRAGGSIRNSLKRSLESRSSSGGASGLPAVRRAFVRP